MPDEDGPAGARRVGDREHLLRPQVYRVTRTPVTGAMSGQVERDNAAVRVKERRDVVPPARMRGGAMDEH